MGIDPATGVGTGVVVAREGVLGTTGTTGTTGTAVAALAYEQLFAVPGAGSPKTLFSHSALPENTFVTARVLVP
ncbi:hypothetical protein [Methylibium sp.]|uniref:hypothetical protein n=1 Tax=Methylibium sp. TaxID=2067992 RepID=UPI003D0E5A77